MGWARTLLLGDIGNRLDIADTEKEIERLRAQLRSSRRKGSTLERRVQDLEEENEQVELFIVTLLDALREKNILSTDEIRNMAEIIDP